MNTSTIHFFSRIPWEKILLWGIVLLAIWIMRSFLAVIFVTFILSYVTHNIIKRIIRYAPAHLKDNIWFRRANVVAIFTILLLMLYTASIMIFPAMFRQGDELITTITQVDPRQKINQIAVNFLGERDLFYYKQEEKSAYEHELSNYAYPKGNPTNAAKITTDVKDKFDQMQVQKMGTQQWSKITASPHYKTIIENVQRFFAEHLGEITYTIATVIKNTATFFIQFFISIIFSFIIVLDIPRLHAQFQTLRQTRLRKFYDTITPGLRTFSDVMGKAFAAQAVIAVCNTVLTYLGMTFLNIPLAELMSLFVFFCSFIPVLGVFISSIPISLVALQNHGFILMLEAIGLITLIHIFEAYVLNPRIMGDFLKIHPLLVLTILFVGEHFFGIWGLLLGVPVCVYIFRYAILDMPFPSKNNT
ncbi:MAG: AI-2E family transporter [Gammaproteobacteria bacterium]|jgi:predicted PurR-regulated permease PerM